jgi:hypothetical protein
LACGIIKVLLQLDGQVYQTLIFSAKSALANHSHK